MNILLNTLHFEVGDFSNMVVHALALLLSSLLPLLCQGFLVSAQIQRKPSQPNTGSSGEWLRRKVLLAQPRWLSGTGSSARIETGKISMVSIRALRQSSVCSG
jgi:hypothetical protein